MTTTPPCRREWSTHLRRSTAVHSHICPLGLRCSCIPIHLNDELVGVVKLVGDRAMSSRRFAAATGLLGLVVSALCHESAVSTLSDELAALRECLGGLRETRSTDPAVGPAPPLLETAVRTTQCRDGGGLVDLAISYLQRHYHAPGLSLLTVARTLRCNPKYLTTRFTRVIGEHMHAYLVRLRVARACRLLLETSAPIKEVAYLSGFRHNASLARAFRRFVGVAPGEYRRIFRDA